jgi:sugar lactone lactonase YvrE
MAGSGVASNKYNVPITSIAQITIDDEGRNLRYPYTVFYDPLVEEIYVAEVGLARVVVYGPDFFPRVSIGRGRGVDAPIFGHVMSNGDVFIGQVKNRESVSNRITILNGAFFLKREILLDEIPEVAGFYPSQFAVSHEGNIYLAGDAGLGVLVLDKDGKFLRRVQPADKIDFLEVLQTWNSPRDELEQQEELEQDTSAESEDTTTEIDKENIPESTRPKPFAALRDRPKNSDGEFPVRVGYVSIDSSGKLYLLSPETSKVYVYGPDENFLFSFGERGGTPGKLSQPRALAIDEHRQLIYITDFMRHTILVYRMSGEYLFEFGGRGAMPGWFNYPNGLAVNSQGQLIVADYFNRRVQVLDVGFEDFQPLTEDDKQDSFESQSSESVDKTEPDELTPAQQEDADEDSGNEDVENSNQKDASSSETESVIDERIEEVIIEQEIIQDIEIPAPGSTSD